MDVSVEDRLLLILSLVLSLGVLRPMILVLVGLVLIILVLKAVLAVVILLISLVLRILLVMILIAALVLIILTLVQVGRVSVIAVIVVRSVKYDRRPRQTTDPIYLLPPPHRHPRNSKWYRNGVPHIILYMQPLRTALFSFKEDRF